MPRDSPLNRHPPERPPPPPPDPPHPPQGPSQKNAPPTPPNTPRRKKRPPPPPPVGGGGGRFSEHNSPSPSINQSTSRNTTAQLGRRRKYRRDLNHEKETPATVPQLLRVHPRIPSLLTPFFSCSMGLCAYTPLRARQILLEALNIRYAKPRDEHPYSGRRLSLHQHNHTKDGSLRCRNLIPLRTSIVTLCHVGKKKKHLWDISMASPRSDRRAPKLP